LGGRLAIGLREIHRQIFHIVDQFFVGRVLLGERVERHHRPA
jgi:hypothetical protein